VANKLNGYVWTIDTAFSANEKAMIEQKGWVRILALSWHEGPDSGKDIAADDILEIVHGNDEDHFLYIIAAGTPATAHNDRQISFGFPGLQVHKFNVKQIMGGILQVWIVPPS